MTSPQATTTTKSRETEHRPLKYAVCERNAALKMPDDGKAEMIESLFGCVVVWFVVGTLSFQKQKNQY